MRHSSRRYSGLLFAVLIACMCGKNPHSPRLPVVSSVIYDSDGETPAQGALVKVFAAEAAGDGPIDICIAGKDGRYSFSDLPDGLYNFWAEKDSMVLFQDSVLVTAGHSTLQDDTLECPSSVTGTVRLEEYHDPRTVSVQPAGIDCQAILPDENGVFTLSGIAAGTWPLLLKSSLPDYLPTLLPVTVKACSNDTLPDTLRLFHTGIPVITDISFTQDTLGGTITLTWRQPEYKMLRDYLVYADRCTSTVFHKTPTYITEDTICVDSLNAFDPENPLDTALRCLHYRIAVRNTLQNIGAMSPPIAFTAAPAAYLTTRISQNVIYADDSLTEASVHDTVGVALSAVNRTRPLRLLTWYDPDRNDTLAGITIQDSSVKELSDTLRCAFDSVGVHRIIATVTDDAGDEWHDTVRINIVQSRLFADAGPDTSLFSFDTVRLHGAARLRFGRIVTWEWKIGLGGEWHRTSGPDTAFPAAAFDWVVVCSLTVTDNDGKKAVDAVSIYIKKTLNLQVTDVSAGSFYNLFLTDDGTLSGRGMNSSGQLGIASARDWVYWENVQAGVTKMSAGFCHSLIIKNDGSLFSFGCNEYGQLGDGSSASRYEPLKIADSVQLVAAGKGHSLMVKTDNSLWTFGQNDCGQLGDGATLDRASPAVVMTGVVGIAAGGSHTLILKNDGTLRSCGLNSYGQLGDASTENRHIPVQIMSGVRSMAAGPGHSVILKNDGTVWTCGWNFSGQLGDGTLETRSTPVKIMEDVRQVAAGDYHTLFLKNDGTVWACGENGSGQLGDGTTIDRTTPVMITGDAAMIDAGAWNSLMIKTDGTIWEWGWISFDADSYATTAVTLVPVRLDL